MTTEEKRILFIDLCPRLPHNVIIRCTDNDTDYKCFLTTDILHEIQNGYEYYDYKPYLRPMSSMTAQEWCELCDCDAEDEKAAIYIDGRRFVSHVNREKFLNSHYFDYGGLIPMGLALEALEWMYKTE